MEYLKRKLVSWCNAFEYNFAILVRIPDSFQSSARKSDDKAEIDMDRARQEHKDLVDTLKKCDVRTIELDGAEEYPQCPFVDGLIYNYIVHVQSVSIITKSCEFEPCSWRGVLHTTLWDKVCQ